MEQELINRFDSLFANISKRIEKKEVFPEIQQEYDELIEFIKNLAILKIDEFVKIEKAFNEKNQKLEKCEEQIKSFINQKKVDDTKIKSLQEKLSKNSNLEEQYKILNENYNLLKANIEPENKEIVNYQLTIRNNEILINDLKKELNNAKKEISEKSEKISNFEKEMKDNENKLNEKINKILEEKKNLSNLNVELRNKNTNQKESYESKIKILEKQLKHLSEANNNFVQENNEVQTQLKDFQLYTNMAKVNTKKLNKEDFSILEIMSKRAESAEMEVQKLLSYIDHLKAVNMEIRNKIKPLEDYALLQIKHDQEISISNETIYDIQNKIFTDEEKKEIFKLKNDSNELFQTLIKLKKENLELHKHIKDITIECNQQLRVARWKIK